MITAALKKYHPSLVSMNHDINADLADFHSAVLLAVKQYEKVIEEAGKVSDDLKPEVRRKRQQEIVAKASDQLQSEVDKAAQPYKVATGEIRQEIENASRPGIHKTETSELIALMKAQEIRRVMSSMSTAEAGQLLRASVAVGDPTILHALEGFIVPLVSAPVMELAQQTYKETAMPDRLQALALSEEYAGSVGTTQRFVESAARAIAEKAGLGEVYAGRGEGKRSEVLNLSDAEKAEFIGENGLSLFKELIK
ncbi:MAG: hypothetical protein CVU69_05090 [Deltaproteobacteria bacterium HGW-Deltaproteobacteria-4]|nr:MAG: hypothetical protein CVU69_05090 [Deltaproteobacteria bacterium HGW-Deltaproteobacteria-4]